MSMLTENPHSLSAVTQAMGTVGINNDYAGPSTFHQLVDEYSESEADSFLNNDPVDSKPDEVEIDEAGQNDTNPEDDEVSIPVMLDVLGSNDNESLSHIQQGIDLNIPASSSPPSLLSVIPFNTKYKNIQLKDLCWRAGAEQNVRKFERIIEKIRELNEEAFDWLQKIDKAQWTLSHDGGWQTDILTTNMSECINGVLKGSRHLPIIAIVRITLDRTVHYFLECTTRYHRMMRDNQQWADYAFRLFESRQGEVVQHIVQKFDYTQQFASVTTRAFKKTYEGRFAPVWGEEDWNDVDFELVDNPTRRAWRGPGRS
ncbi:UNVERIFIED_CONTAM: hypothetical protein Sradi_0179000 [Sesamum radiatum]|uniref:Uncharacterized protein n=1 Tax=Sesamum radiatum TaxID=300843 RepID=A0AAW2W3G0_SESRA